MIPYVEASMARMAPMAEMALMASPAALLLQGDGLYPEMGRMANPANMVQGEEVVAGAVPWAEYRMILAALP